MLLQKLARLFFVIMCMQFSVNPVAASDLKENKDSIKVLTFNILAPCWANPEYYPLTVLPYLNRTYRRDKIINFLQSQSTTDIFTLQEVTQEEFTYLKESFKNEYLAYQSLHAPSYWSNWLRKNLAWEPNGNAIFLKKSRFSVVSFKDIALSSDGNHAAYVEAIDKQTHKKIRAISLHLDSDSGANRKREFQALMHYLPKRSDVIDLVSGDFNTHTTSAALHNEVQKAQFINVLTALGINKVTCPHFISTFNHPNAGVIDHLLIRNGTPQQGQVLDYGLLQIYPYAKDKGDRLTASIKLSGSDHFPVKGSFVPNV